MSASAPNNLRALGNAISDYARLKGISTAAALNKHAVETAFNLYRSFRQLAPEGGEIREEAEARDWRMRISATAARRAARILGTQGQVLGTVTSKGVRTFRLSKTGKLISGGRAGTRGTAAPVQLARSYASLERYLGGGVSRKYRVLNTQAVRTAEELRKRDVARGFLAISWLPDGIRRISRSSLVGYSRTRRNKTGTLLGWIDSTARPGLFRSSQTVSLTSQATGVSKYPEARHAAVNASLANIAAYFAKKKRKDLADAIHRRIAATPLA